MSDKAENQEVTPYVVIADGGRQYRVTEGQVLDIDYRDGIEEGSELVFDRVLAVSNGSELKFGTPAVEGASVTAKVLGQTKGEKLYIQKFRRRKNFRKRFGHRQKYTRVKIEKLPG